MGNSMTSQKSGFPHQASCAMLIHRRHDETANATTSSESHCTYILLASRSGFEHRVLYKSRLLLLPVSMLS